MDREDRRLVGRMAVEFLDLLALLPTATSGSPAGAPSVPPEVAERSDRMDELAEEIRARREERSTES